MTNTSATGGYLVPSAPGPTVLEDDALGDALQAVVVGIVGLDPTLVRPRWQVKPPAQPPATTDWCAIGVTEEEPDANAAVIHHCENNGTDETQRQMTLSILASFFGPNAAGNASRLRDGFWVAQNREWFQLNGFGFLDVDRATRVPELTNQVWINRVDLPFRVRYQVTRIYPVMNIISAGGTIETQQGSVEGQVQSTEPWQTKVGP